MAETSTLLMCRMGNCTEGSNPSSSATCMFNTFRSLPLNSYNPFIYNGYIDLIPGMSIEVLLIPTNISGYNTGYK